MSIFKNKASLEAKVEIKNKKTLPPAGAWGNYSSRRRYLGEHNKYEKTLLVQIKDITLAYEGRAVISDLSFEIYSGDYLCIIGENGSGKTTLMNALLGLKKPLRGELIFNGLVPSEIGVLPQKTPVQNDFPAHVSEIVLSGFVGKKRGFAFYTKKDKQIAFENMEKLGITSLSKHSFRELSGGQQQRVLLARALCAAEKLIVLDEPAASLDPKAAFDMYKLISDMNREKNMTVVMVSHDINAALEHASHILRIGKSSVFFGTRDEYLAQLGREEKSEELYGNSDAYRYKGGERDA